MFKPLHAFVLTVAVHIPLGHATHWPMLIAPDIQFLQSEHHITQAGCPQGEGKVTSGLKVSVSPKLCKTFCPGNWFWISNSDGQCHSLQYDFYFRTYHIHSSTNNDGESESIVMASYGSNESAPHTTFTLVTPPEEHWLCAEAHPSLHVLSCSNDT